MLRFLMYFVLGVALQAVVFWLNAATGFADWLVYSLYDLPTILLLWGPSASGTKIGVSTFQLVALPTIFYSVIFALIATLIRRFTMKNSNSLIW